ncbi:MAG: rRNA maturation RNase YbeY [Ignavibacteria bacterium]|nr:rRNA maturation RNase YbeY [Ignavibacteria bacterium]
MRDIIFKYKFIGNKKNKILPVRKLYDRMKEIVNTVFENEKKEYSIVSFLFCDNAYIRIINKKYLLHNYATDVVTFRYSEFYEPVEADVVISLDMIQSNARKYNTDFDNELFRIVIHSVLHLSGYNDVSKTEKKIMKNLEDYYLSRYADFLK